MALALPTSVDVYRAESEAPLPAWPLLMMVGLYPLWFILGLAGFMWIALTPPILVALLRKRELVAPKGFAVWMIFILAACGSLMSVDTFSRGAVWILRFGYYIGATAFLIYLVNGSTGITVWRIIRMFTFFWMATVVGGYLAFVLGDFTFRSPAGYILPGILMENDLIKTLATPGFADLQDIIGFPVPRPKAPFPYTNSWGSMMALLTPFALMAFNDNRAQISQKLLRVMLIASVVPAVVSLNRGLWLSFGVGFLYVTFRLSAYGFKKIILRLLVVSLVLVCLFFFTPLGEIVSARLSDEGGHSDADRTELAVAAFEGSLERPVFGWGVPRPNVRNLPPIGTHGQIWNLLFTHGFVGAFGWIAGFMSFFWFTRKQKTTVGMWANAVILISLVQIPFYLQVPHQLFTVMAGIAIAVRMLGEEGHSAKIQHQVV